MSCSCRHKCILHLQCQSFILATTRPHMNFLSPPLWPMTITTLALFRDFDLQTFYFMPTSHPFRHLMMCMLSFQQTVQVQQVRQELCHPTGESFQPSFAYCYRSLPALVVPSLVTHLINRRLQKVIPGKFELDRVFAWLKTFCAPWSWNAHVAVIREACTDPEPQVWLSGGLPQTYWNKMGLCQLNDSQINKI